MTSPDRVARPGARSAAGASFGASFGASLLAVLASCASGGGGPNGGGDDDDGSGGTGNRLSYDPKVVVTNHHANARHETIRASVPFPEGLTTSLDSYGISGISTAWLPLQHWPDGSVRIAQAQFTDTLAPDETREYDVVGEVIAMSGPFRPHDWLERFGGGLEFGARVEDRFGVSYYASTGGATATVVQETPLVRVKHYRLYHRASGGGGIGRDFLTSQFYVTEHRDTPVVTVDWIVGNDYLGADDPRGSTDPNLYPLGCIDVDAAEFRVRGHAAARAYKPHWHGVEGGVHVDPWTTFRTMTATYLDDGQTRRYRFFVKVEDPGAAQVDKDRADATFVAMSEEWMVGLANLATWQVTSGANILGGPVDGPDNAKEQAAGQYHDWSNRDHFGTWGAFGDVYYTGTSGSPRNGPMSEEFAHAIQAEYPRLLVMLEGRAWIQSVRPYHLYGLEVGAEQQILLWDPIPVVPGSRDLSHESLGRRAIWRGSGDPYAAYRQRSDFRGHNWNGYDDEHFTMDLLFDYWTVSGDAWAKEELRQLGQSLKALIRLRDYATANMRVIRAEGWTMRGFVHAYLATGDESIKSYALRRIHEVVDVQRLRDHPSGAMQEKWPDARIELPPDTTYYSAWEYGPFLMGFLGAHQFFGDDKALELCELALDAVEYAWVSDYTHPRTSTYIEHGIRYGTPMRRNGTFVAADFADNDANYGALVLGGLGGVNMFLVAGVNSLAKYSRDDSVKDRALMRGRLMLANSYPWDRWACVAPHLYENPPQQ